MGRLPVAMAALARILATGCGGFAPEFRPVTTFPFRPV